MRRTKAIYMHGPSADRLWRDILFEVIGDKHELSDYDPSKPMEQQFAETEVLLDDGGRMATRDIFQASPSLKLWQMITVGYDAVDLSIVDGTNVPVAHCPGSTSAPGLAESALMFMLMLVKRYRRGQADVAEGKICVLVSDELEDKTLVIIGFGASGRRLAPLAKAFGMKLMIIEPLDIEQEVLDQLQPEFVGKPADLDNVIPKADFISIHCPVMPATRGMIDARRIALMKPTASFINVARPALVDEDALNQALLDGRIAGIGSDVFADLKPGKEIPAFHHDYLVSMPHIAGVSLGTIRRRAKVCLENLDRIAQGLEPNYRVR